MEKKLAIKRHPTRDKEVIELLEMMGGKSTIPISATLKRSVYTISDGVILEIPHYNIKFDDFVIFTLEEFLEKFPFKVGEFVFAGNWSHAADIRKMRWNPNTKEVEYMVKPGTSELWYTANKLTRYSIPKFNTGETVYNKHTRKFGEIVKYQWQKDEYIYLIHHLMEDAWYLERQLTKDVNEVKSNEYADEMQTKRDMDETMFMLGHTLVPNKVDDNLEYKIIDGYEFDRVENDKIILKVVKHKYPKTYEECCSVIGINWYDIEIDIPQPYQQKMFNFLKLRICRDAYWKIVGEEMGLGKPWEPDWTNENQEKYCICYGDGNIRKITWRIYNSILAFPTEEVRDVFYENFKDLIEQCKELL